jgi:predicted phosphate transport protein (TIGR00153 family)
VVEGPVAARRPGGREAVAAVFRLIPREGRFFDLFEEQAKNIVAAAARLREMVFDFSDAPAKSMAIRELEHEGDALTHDLIRKINTTFVTPFDREDVYALASRLDDVLDLVEAAADRLVLYRIKEPTSGARAFADVIVETAGSVQEAVGCLRTSSKSYHVHCVEVNRLENEADRLLKELIAALFADVTDPIEVIKWKEIYETLEEVTDRCEDVVNVIEGIMLKMG